jgi:glycosyltransferase 2 family protein
LSLARRVGGLLAAALVAAFLVWGVVGGFGEAADYDWQLDGPLLAAAVAALALFYLAWIAGYLVLLESLARGRLERRMFASIFARSLLGRYVPGNVLMVAGRVVLGREAGVPARTTLSASVYEQVALLVAGALGAAAYVLLWDDTDRSAVTWIVLAVPLSLVVLDPAILGRLAAWMLRRLGRPAELVTLGRAQVAALLAWACFTMGLLGLGMGLGVQAVAGESSGDVATFGLGFLLAWTISMIAFVFPSGLGVREATFAAVLARELPGPAAVSVAAGSRLLMTAVELVVVAAVVALGRAR